MKNAVRLALLCMAATAVPAYAQTALPQCVVSNLDQSRQLFTVMNPTAADVNQQCLLSVYQPGTMPDSVRNSAAGYFVAGRYVIDLSGGGGGGGGGAVGDKGGGGGGAGAAPLRTTQFLAPGTYKLTIGTGGSGGRAAGGRTEAGNPTSITNLSTGQLVAGFAGADTWTQQSVASGSGRGGQGPRGGSTGGDGGNSRGTGSSSESGAQTGSASATPGYYGTAGQGGSESGRSATNDAGRQVVQANAGGGGGASAGSGGAGDSAGRNSVAGAGDLGGGGGGGRGGVLTADSGGTGGHGFIRLALVEAAPMALAPVPVAPVPVAPVAAAPQYVAPVRVSERITMSSDALFGFGQSTLRPAGEARLDELINSLRDVDIERISDVGHADRLGTSETNQKMSESRAEAVKAYLVRRGIPADRITATGMGETQPVTGSDACTGPKKADIIACLQPDRRVDIQVVGTRR